MLSLTELDCAGKVALVRADLNVPLANCTIVDDNRISASLPSLQAILADGGACVVMSHLGRPTEGQYDPALSLAPVAARLQTLLGHQVRLVSLAKASRPAIGEVLLLENTRFNIGEQANDTQLAKRYAALGDVFVMDAFASSHRIEASTVALAHAATERCAGLLLRKEIDALQHALHEPRRPLLAIVGGAKISTKLEVLASLARIADNVIVGGGIANTFILAQGHAIGQSLVEANMQDLCKQMLAEHGDKIRVPAQVIVANSLDVTQGKVCASHEIADDEMILDAGPDALAQFQLLVAQAGTIVWNGALGVFEKEAFAAGTRSIAEAIAQAPGFSLAGGGETVAAAKQYQLAEHIDCLSTGGGAFLEFVEGKQLPALQALQ